MQSNEIANTIRTAEELERIVTIIQNPTQYKIPSCTNNPDFDSTLFSLLVYSKGKDVDD